VAAPVKQDDAPELQRGSREDGDRADDWETVNAPFVEKSMAAGSATTVTP